MITEQASIKHFRSISEREYNRLSILDPETLYIIKTRPMFYILPTWVIEKHPRFDPLLDEDGNALLDHNGIAIYEAITETYKCLWWFWWKIKCKKVD